MEVKLNDGQGHGFEEIKAIGFEQAAEQFAEGNKTLKQILLNLWEMGIETAASCKGEHTEDHKMENDLFFKFPYISFAVNEKSKDKLIELVKYIATEKGTSKPDIEYKNYIFNNENYRTLVLNRTFLTNANANKMFEIILKAIEKMQQKQPIKQSEDLKLTTELIENIATTEIFRGQPVCSINVKISHNNECLLVAKDVCDKRVKRKINDKTIDKITKFCDGCLFERSITV